MFADHCYLENTVLPRKSMFFRLWNPPIHPTPPKKKRKKKKRKTPLGPPNKSLTTYLSRGRSRAPGEEKPCAKVCSSGSPNRRSGVSPWYLSFILSQHGARNAVLAFASSPPPLPTYHPPIPMLKKKQFQHAFSLVSPMLALRTPLSQLHFSLPSLLPKYNSTGKQHFHACGEIKKREKNSGQR